MTEKNDPVPVLEGILFAMGKSVEIKILSAALELSEEETILALKKLQDFYVQHNSGIQLLFLENHVQLATKPEYYEYLIRVAVQPKKPVMTGALMETLSIVAYKQPVTRIEIERIRGVNSDHAVNKLIDYGLIEEAGRLDAPGRPILFATTEEFLRTFGVSSLTDLPGASPEIMDTWKEEAEQEVPVDV